ncbi:MAG: SH3 domain-containing protein, partial [Chloroflexota bacterium]|nr:SH3 domain-containing protein [Chloroflexota bacterium]
MFIATEGYTTANLRERASTESRVLRSVPYRAEVSASARSVETAGGESWRQVKYRDTQGYVLASLLSERRPAPEPSPTPTPEPALVPTATPLPTATAVPAATDTETNEGDSAPGSVGAPVRLLINTNGVQV